MRLPSPKVQNPKWDRLILILILMLVFSYEVRAEETLRLEGVIEDQVNKAESLAVINGDLYKVHDRVGLYRVEEIQANQVKLLHQQTQQEIRLEVKAAPPKPASVPASPPTLFEQAKSYLNRPDKVMNRAWEIKALRDLAIINNAAVKYCEKNQFFPVSMKQLTLDGFLPQEYEEGTLSKYRFYFSNKPQKPDDLQLHADPLAGKHEFRSFFLGADAVIRESLGSPAQKNSPPHHYPGKKV